MLTNAAKDNLEILDYDTDVEQEKLFSHEKYKGERFEFYGTMASTIITSTPTVSTSISLLAKIGKSKTRLNLRLFELDSESMVKRRRENSIL
jgi:hypothetical protein